MKRMISLLFVASLFPICCQASNLRSFLRACAWGTAGGAAVGVVSLAFADKPNESWNNVAKGASLGLYAGIAYGILQANQPEFNATQSPDYTLSPQFHEGAVEGLQVSGIVYSF